MGLLNRIRRNAVIASGDFGQIFSDFNLPPCPEVVLTLTKAVRNPDISIDQVVAILETDPALTSIILKTVNSALYRLQGNISSVSRAVSILGLREVENTALGYAMRQAVSDPGLDRFDFNTFWTDSLLRALFARNAASVLEVEADEAFAAGLLQDMALPVLLTQWLDVYGPVYQEWSSSGIPIHLVEQKRLSWSHCQAAAWIASNWGLPDLMVCCVGLHSASLEDISSMGLEGTAVTAVVLSSLITHAFREVRYAVYLVERSDKLGIPPDRLMEIAEVAGEQVEHLAASLDINTCARPDLVQILREVR
ncbi:MAG TPA: HDOD domain-containing protein [Thermodesulfobacteriaceae bacterium]|nr:HDOD domain-containing protein [Thermodesulfobacteriaceae bacterium]